MPDLNAIVKAYDIRGIVPEQLDASAAYAFGVAFAKFTGASAIVVAHDMRPSGPELVDAFQRGALAHGVDVTNVGLASSDLLYYASGKFNMPMNGRHCQPMLAHKSGNILTPKLL